MAEIIFDLQTLIDRAAAEKEAEDYWGDLPAGIYDVDRTLVKEI